MDELRMILRLEGPVLHRCRMFERKPGGIFEVRNPDGKAVAGMETRFRATEPPTLDQESGRWGIRAEVLSTGG